jgi:hypothetical protein
MGFPESSFSSSRKMTESTEVQREVSVRLIARNKPSKHPDQGNGQCAAGRFLFSVEMP